MKLLKDLKYYLKQQLDFLPSKKYLDGCEKEYPVAKLGDVFIKFPHSSTVEEVNEKWNRRLKRINFNKIFVQMSIISEETAKEFDKLPFENKVGFAYNNYNLQSCIYVKDFYKGFEDRDIPKWYCNQFAYFNTLLFFLEYMEIN